MQIKNKYTNHLIPLFIYQTNKHIITQIANIRPLFDESLGCVFQYARSDVGKMDSIRFDLVYNE